MNLDAINRCHWIITMQESNRLEIQRYYFAGSYDNRLFDFNESFKKSSKEFQKFVCNMNKIIIHYTGSNVIPKYYLTENLELFIEFLDFIPKLLLTKNESLYNIIIFLINSNLRRFKSNQNIRDLCLKIIPNLPHSYATFLYFNNLHIMLYECKNESIEILITLLHKTKSQKILSFIYSKLESCQNLAYIQFDLPNKISEMLPQNTISSSLIPNENKSILLIHQRVLISTVSIYLRDNNLDEVNFDDKSLNDINNPLGCLTMYCKILSYKFNFSILLAKTADEIEKSFILLLIDNFMCLLTSLSSYHIIARILTDIFSDLLSKIYGFISNKSLEITDDSDLSSIVRLFLFVYGKFAATLLQGTKLSNFEKEFSHLISLNLDNNNQKDLFNTDINCFSEILNNFLGEKGDIYVMSHIYKNYKPSMNKNLSNDIKLLDRVCLAAFCKHQDLFNELIERNETFSVKLKSVLEQMIRVRNIYRSQKQSGKESLIYKKCHLLLRLNKDITLTPKQMGDFACSKESIEEIISLINQQKSRSRLTLIGFELIDNVLAYESSSIFIEIFAYTLSKIQNFEGLSTVMQITNINNEEIISKLFGSRILKIILNNPKSKLSLVAYRFFRDTNQLQNLKETFLNKVLEKNIETHDLTLFALSLSLIQYII